MNRDERDRWSLVDAEAALVRGMLAGDARAFERFADLYLPPLYRFAERRLGDREQARDVVQATLCKAIAKLASFRGEAGLATWLCACCRNEIASHYRRRARAGVEVEWDEELAEVAGAAAGGSASPEQELLRSEDRRTVHDRLDQLPPQYARALEWKYVDELAVDEIAERLGISPKAAESLLSRARAAFRAGMELSR